MRALKITVIVLFSTIALILIAALFLPKEVSISQSELIKAKPEVVFRQVNSLKNYVNWSPFEEDTTMTSTYEGPEMGVGAVRKWTGDRVGTGKLEIVKSIPYLEIVNHIEFDPQGKANETWKFDATIDGVNVIWSLKVIDLNYPLGRIFGYFMDDMMKPMQKRGLENLKKISESLPAPPDVAIIELDTLPSLVIYDSTTISGIGKLLEKNYAFLIQFVMKNKLQVTGAPFAIYHNWDPEGIIRISVGIPIDKQVTGTGPIKYYEMPAGNYVFAEHIGGYNTENTHYAIDAFIQDYNLKIADFIWEAYVTDPASEPDSTKWVTYIYYPLIVE